MPPPTTPPPNHVFDPGDPASLPYQTSINRRHATRTVPLRLLCLGLSRTGTVSLRQALVRLGYTETYHFASVLQENPLDALLWTEALEAKFLDRGTPYGKAEWDALLGHCQAVTDAPCSIFYEDLLAAYPDAKVILTERESADEWFGSQMRTLVPYASGLVPRTWWGRVMAVFSPLDKTMVRLNELIVFHTPVFRTLWDDYHEGTERGKGVYEEYNAEIKRIVPAERLLVFNVKDGWKPLCEFLGEKVPVGEEFPRRNGEAVFVRNNQQFGEFVQAAARKNMAIVGAGVVAALALGVAGFMARRR